MCVQSARVCVKNMYGYWRRVRTCMYVTYVHTLCVSPYELLYVDRAIDNMRLRAYRSNFSTCGGSVCWSDLSMCNDKENRTERRDQPQPLDEDLEAYPGVGEIQCRQTLQLVDIPVNDIESK